MAQCSVTTGPDLNRCFGQPAALGTGLTFTGTNPVSFSWSNGLPSVQNPVIPASTSNIYTVTITDANGCVASDQISLNVLPLPTVNAGTDITICAGSPTTLCATATSSNGAISIFTWNGGPANACYTVSPTTPNTYSVTAADAAGCQKSDAITVFVNPLPAVSAGLDQSICTSQGPVQLTGSPAGGTWSGTGVSSGGLFTPTSTGSFTLTYNFINSNNCPGSDQLVMAVTSPIAPNGGVDQAMCLNAPAIQLPTVGVWSGSGLVSTGGVFTPSTAGTYNLTVTSGTGLCTANDQVTVLVRALPIVNAGIDIAICVGQNTQLVGTASSPNGAITNTVWGGGWVNNASIISPIANPPLTTIYTLFITDATNCQSNDQVVVTVNTLPNANAGNDITFCNNQSAVALTGQSPAGGVWSGAGVSIGGLFTPGATGNFTLTYTVSNGANCTDFDTRVVTVISSGSANAGNDLDLCHNSPATQLAVGGAWSGSSLVSSGGLFTPSATGVYNLTYIVLNGICTVSDQMLVNVRALPTVNAGSDVSICAGQTTTLQGSASSPNGSITNINWTGGAVSNSAIFNPTTNPGIATTFNLTVTDASNCQKIDQVVVSVNALPIVDAGLDLTVCSNSSATTLSGQTPSGGTWSGLGVTSVGVFTPSSTGTFTLTYSFTNGSGCSSTNTRDIFVTAPGLVNGGNDVSICLNTPSIQLATGGTWSGSALVTNSGIFTPSAVASYNLTYTASTGLCMASDQVTVTVLALPTVNAGIDVVMCDGQNTTLSGIANSPNGTILTVSWTGGSVSNNAILNPNASPNSSTTYTLTVADVAACQNSDQLIVTVNALPSVNAGQDITICSNSGAVTLSGQTPSSGSWTGSGVSSSGIFTPSTTGTFILTYSFTNGANCTSTDTRSLIVTAPGTVNAGNDFSVCLNTTPVQLNTSGTWTGSPLVSTGGLFTPSNIGIYTLTYTASTGLCMASDNLVVNVNAIPNVNLGSDASVCIGDTFQLNSVISGGMTPYTFNWDDIVSNDAIADPTVTIQNSQIINLTVIDINNCIASDNISINAITLPIANFTTPAMGCVNSAISLNNTSTFAVTYQWDFGAGSSSNLQNPSYQYASAGVYNVVLTAFNSIGCSHQTTNTIEIISAPIADFGLSTYSGCSPLYIEFNNMSTGSYISYAWNINGNPDLSNQPEPQYLQVYNAISNASVELTVTNVCGSNSHNEIVIVNPLPNADFNTALSSFCSPVTTTFVNTSSGNADSYFWDLGDGNTTDATAPVPNIYVTDQNSANFTIKLLAYNSCGVDSVESVVTVLPNTVYINLTTAVQSGCSPLFVPFINGTVGATNYTYDFGDGSSSTLISPNHVYSNPGTYQVYLNADDGCSFSSSQLTIEVIETPTISISADIAELCPDEMIQFTSTTIGNQLSVLWDFADGNTSIDFNPQHQYAIGNNYVVSASVYSDNGCGASASISVMVHSKPDSVILPNSSSSCSPFNLCVQTANPSNYTYNWIIQNAAMGNAATLCHQLTNFSLQPQSYIVELNVESDFGCINDGEVTVEVLPQPQTSFVLSANESCFELETINVNVITNGANQYQWYVNDAPQSASMTPAFQFMNLGDHVVKLESANLFGCTDEHQEIFTIHPKPIVDIMPDVFNGCLPLQTGFDNNTQNASQWFWTFGNGTVSNSEQPWVVFENAGLFDVQLQAISEHGCESIAFYDDMIEVFPLPTAEFEFTPEGDIIYELSVDFINGSSGEQSYEWNFGDGSFSSQKDPLHSYQRGGEYDVQLIVKNEYGCGDSIEKTVNIDNTLYFYIPNAFTPGTDGVNDYFAPVFSDEYQLKSYELVIMDRWGEEVFRSSEPTMAWNGSVKGGEYFVHNDVFNYTLRISDFETSIFRVFTGTVTALR